MNAAQDETLRSDAEHEKAGVEAQASSTNDFVDVVRYAGLHHCHSLSALHPQIRR